MYRDNVDTGGTRVARVADGGLADEAELCGAR